MSLFLIILAAGEGKRLKSKTPKPYTLVNNKSLLEHSIDAFSGFDEIKKTVVVYNKKHKKQLDKLKLQGVIKITGGISRQSSTLRALKKIEKMNCTKVLIHDSARPNTPIKVIAELIKKLKRNHAVVPIIKPSDAVKRVKKNIIFKNIDRNSLRFSQTPQGFTFKKIYAKHLKNTKNKIDDDISLFIDDIKKTISIKGDKKNIKITDKEDLEILKRFKKGKIYSGIGFDVHKLVKNRKLYLGGIRIKSKVGTLGHSDGDPVLHATIDAILGACKMGDIGEMFSDKEKKFQNIRSNVLIKAVMEKIKLKGFFINNIDINIIAQTPKIQKYKKKMRLNISKLCKIHQNQINIKGKTTEKLGVIGNEKAIASEVIVTTIKYD
jgi:2-C-methyl-D-erythritol 4-phosphate cytidylyltransferase/2-C-methyl-D-erythritol 2,4-cyclodiphosphate synthase